MKADEVGALREQTLTDNRDVLIAAAARPARPPRRGRKAARLRKRRLGDGRDGPGRGPPCGAEPQWPSRRAIDLTEDPAILTAIANDIGTEEIFQRQLIAYGREGDAAVALSTSGNSVNVIEALVEARTRGLETIAFVGYDGGRVAAGGARRPRRRHAVTAHPADPGGAGERLPRAAGAGGARPSRRRPERASSGSAPAAGPGSRLGDGSGRRLQAACLPPREELELGGQVLNDEHGVLIEVEGAPERIEEFLAPPARAEAPPMAAVETPGDGGRALHGRARVHDRRPRSAPATRTSRSRLTPPPATTACRSSSIPATAGTGTPSSTAPTADPGSRS